MPHTDGSLNSNVRDGSEQVSGLKKSGSSKGSLKKLTRQSQVESEKRREMLKQESKDSGIVTEMGVRTKDLYPQSSQKEYHRSESTASTTKAKRSFKSKGHSEKIKRSQSVKEKRHREPVEAKERSHDDLEIELLTPKQNGSVEDDQEKKNPSTIRGMWKKAFKTLKSSSSVEKLSKKSSFSKKKQSSKEADDEVEQVNTGPVDPVYSLLKCAADLPRSGGKSPCLMHAHCSGQHTPGYSRYPSGGDSSGNTSKTSSPSSSAGAPSPEDKMNVLTASSLRKKFALARASSLEIVEKKNRSYSPSPKGSPKSQRKDIKNLYVALYNFKPKEKDDIDLRAGWRVSVIESSKKDWWKGRCRGRTGYFPATYVIPLQYDQRVFQVLQPLNLSDGNYSIKFHKDQIVLQIGEEVDGMILVRAANNRQALCPLIYLQEL